MKNIPRIFVGNDVATGARVPATADVAHYLMRVMRRHDCIVFGGGREFMATLADILVAALGGWYLVGLCGGVQFILCYRTYLAVWVVACVGNVDTCLFDEFVYQWWYVCNR